MSSWAIKGVGICLSDVLPYINKTKLYAALCRLNPKFRGTYSGRIEDLDVNDYISGIPFDGYGEMFWICDDSDALTYCDDNEGRAYLYYPPCMPWELSDSDPKTLGDVHTLIVKAVGKLVNLPSSRINELINDELFIICED